MNSAAATESSWQGVRVGAAAYVLAEQGPLGIGTKDAVDLAATEDPTSIASMPVLKIWDADDVFVFNRSTASGYDGEPNPLFYRDNTGMLFGDGKQCAGDILHALSTRARGQYTPS